MGNQINMGHIQNIQSFGTSIETGNLQSYDEQSIGSSTFDRERIFRNPLLKLYK